jgi:hypothetical protein
MGQKAKFPALWNRVLFARNREAESMNREDEHWSLREI